ncbi:MAG: hypothetical protein B6I28_00565 [Fusobacteriia bacterium 4572_132]|nr:MAG: hypothetical protein B6I28_00565 [Fusobacteriia bacterium 4572_132]
MYKVIEVANMLGVSKVTIYKKMEIYKKELKSHIHKKQNITYIDDKGVDIIKNSLSILSLNSELEVEYKKKIELIEKKLEKQKSGLSKMSLDFNRTLIDSTNNVKSYIRMLENQIKFKKRELEHKNLLLKEFKELIKENKNRINYLEDILKK